MKRNVKMDSLFGKLAIISLIGLLATGCFYDNDEFVQPEIIVSGEVSFSKSVQPIFTANCSLTSCHVSGGESPNLSAGVAYEQLFDKNLINLENPAASVLIKRMRSTTDPMPTGGNLPQAQINLIETWISQGALNN